MHLHAEYAAAAFLVITLGLMVFEWWREKKEPKAPLNRYWNP